MSPAVAAGAPVARASVICGVDFAKSADDAGAGNYVLLVDDLSGRICPQQ